MKENPEPSGEPQSPRRDWREIHDRLAAIRETFARSRAPGAREQRAILQARARALAREQAPDLPQQAQLDVVEFLLAYERYGVEVSFVREIYPLKAFTPLPCAPPFVLGILNVRGQILSVIDLKRFFELPDRGLTDLNKVIILRQGAMVFGILADAVVGVRSIPLDRLQPSLPTLTGIREEYLKGVTPDHLVVLEAAKLLSDKRMTVHEEVML
jgi:purine-binding chemotaxis protein CheW